MVKGIYIKRIFAVCNEVNLVFGVGFEPYLEMSSWIAKKFGYDLETEEGRKNAILDIYKNGYLPKYIYTELTACINGKGREINIKKDVEFLYIVAKRIYDTANIKAEDLIEKYGVFRFNYDSLQRSWMPANEAFTIQRKGEETDSKFYRIICYAPSERIMDSDRRLFKYMYDILDNHYDMIANGFPDGNDNINARYLEEFKRAFSILSMIDPLSWKMELYVVFLQIK